MKVTTKQITMTAALLAICIVSQFLKNTSVYITGPIINACLILAGMSGGMVSGILLAVITPITSFFITGSPIVAIMPCIMAGNAILVIGVCLAVQKKPGQVGMVIGMTAGSLVKAVFMGVVISMMLIPMLLPEKMQPKMAVFQTTFSVTQLITALIGSVLAYIIWIPLQKVMKEQ